MESHILACDSCVSRLEELEIQMGAVKLALRELIAEPKAEKVPRSFSFKPQFAFRSLAWAGAVGALALAVTLTPRFMSRPFSPVEVSLAANRGSGSPSVPQGKPLHLHLSAQDIANGPVRVVIVQGDGSEVWKCAAKAQNDQVDVSAPKIDRTGTHFLRIYSVRQDNSAGDLLREFPFEVR